MTPAPWAFALLALAAFRVWKLIAEDTILDRPRAKLTTPFVVDFLSCPWCAGFWSALAWTVAFWIWPHWTLVAATPFALSAAVAAVAVALDALAQTSREG